GLKEPIGSVLQTASSGSQLKPPALPGDTYLCVFLGMGHDFFTDPKNTVFKKDSIQAVTVTHYYQDMISSGHR
ncbi:MAG: hypothetical protein JAY75_16490, partial [Candidatus Thiodiazotropha taylori]|nr:hypothetical protein [Candidatus Thiodiazotropha taylori]MCG8077820.1 hypothetical protein [Candidatus Thiodiazotropha taylori]MCW4226891.1 hypothetical protein [Candidatus Thiodiazotropha endolucinida]MCW4309814.1 hypothetical protein [Candidatus Thiodiazotropha endolucinida]